MAVIMAFAVGLVASFVGSIPPGTINLLVFQLGLNRQIKIAMRLTAAVAIVEYPYAWISVEFANMITSSPAVKGNMQLITSVVMIVIGVIGLLPSKQQSTSSWVQKFNNSGFRRGIVLGILNPMAIPFWVGVTAFLTEQKLLDISTVWRLHAYLVGISLGTVALLIVFAYLAQKIVTRFGDVGKLKNIPAYVILALGVYALFGYLFL